MLTGASAALLGPGGVVELDGGGFSVRDGVGCDDGCDGLSGSFG